MHGFGQYLLRNKGLTAQDGSLGRVGMEYQFPYREDGFIRGGGEVGRSLAKQNKGSELAPPSSLHQHPPLRVTDMQVAQGNFPGVKNIALAGLKRLIGDTKVGWDDQHDGHGQNGEG